MRTSICRVCGSVVTELEAPLHAEDHAQAGEFPPDPDEVVERTVPWDGRKPPPWVCTHCQAGNCTNCIDIMRVVADLGEICKCRRKNHSGEPVLQQVADPTTGSVFGPGMEVTQDGEFLRSVPPAVEP